MLDYTSSELGAGMPVRRSATDMGEVVEEVVRQSELTHPGREFRTELRGDLAGEWDLGRIRQALLNLIDNAVQHGSPGSAIPVSVSGAEDGDVVVSVHNLGVAIPDDSRDRIFEPFQRRSPGGATGEEIANATGSDSTSPGGWPRRTGEPWKWSPPPTGARPSRFGCRGTRRPSPVTDPGLLVALGRVA